MKPRLIDKVWWSLFVILFFHFYEFRLSNRANRKRVISFFEESLMDITLLLDDSLTRLLRNFV